MDIKVILKTVFALWGKLFLLISLLNFIAENLEINITKLNFLSILIGTFILSAILVLMKSINNKV